MHSCVTTTTAASLSRRIPLFRAFLFALFALFFLPSVIISVAGRAHSLLVSVIPTVMPTDFPLGCFFSLACRLLQPFTIPIPLLRVIHSRPPGIGIHTRAPVPVNDSGC